jgi:hypothetical protein
MSAFPLTLEPGLFKPSASLVLESLRARRQESGKGNLALALGSEAEVKPEHSPEGLEALFMPGAVVELSALPGAGALTLGLRLLAEARRKAVHEGRPSWLCVVDPTRTLHAPAVAALGLELDKLVVLQPDADRTLRTAVRAARSGAFCGLLVDGSARGDVSDLVTPVRRLTLAAEESGATGVLVTSSRARRGLPLPVAARALVENVPSPERGDELHVRFLRHRHGQVPRVVVPRAASAGGGRGSGAAR